MAVHALASGGNPPRLWLRVSVSSCEATGLWPGCEHRSLMAAGGWDAATVLAGRAAYAAGGHSVTRKCQLDRSRALGGP
eukprot:9481178-Pyramimonas_sp.AAC.1